MKFDIIINNGKPLEDKIIDGGICILRKFSTEC